MRRAALVNRNINGDCIHYVAIDAKRVHAKMRARSKEL